MIELYGHILGGEAWQAQVDDLDAGRPIVVRGWEINASPRYSNYCVESDGTVTPVEAVFVDTDAPVRSVVNYRRPDGSLVRNNPDARAVSAFGAGSGTALVTTTTDPAHI